MYGPKIPCVGNREVNRVSITGCHTRFAGCWCSSLCRSLSFEPASLNSNINDALLYYTSFIKFSSDIYLLISGQRHFPNLFESQSQVRYLCVFVRHVPVSTADANCKCLMVYIGHLAQLCAIIVQFCSHAIGLHQTHITGMFRATKLINSQL